MPDTADPTAEAKADKKKQPHHPRDPAREVVETIVFVVVLVLLLKLFVTEAFVIPTGSMAETLFGYQKQVKCPKCGHEFPVNSHDEVEGRDGKRLNVIGYCCPNCRHRGLMADLDPQPQNNTGDRVLVLKPLFHVRDPRRGDVVVFKYPDKPQEKWTAQNYIKRCMGFGGETVGIYRGDLFVTRAIAYPHDAVDENGKLLYPLPSDELDLWKPGFMYPHIEGTTQTNPLASGLFGASRAAGFPSSTGGFEIVRKEEDHLLADMRVVWDNDKQPAELAGRALARWYAPAGEWKGDNQQTEHHKVFGHDKPDEHWIRYRHLPVQWASSPKAAAIRPAVADLNQPQDVETLRKQTPTFIDNFLGYNAGLYQDLATGHIDGRDNSGADKLWVGDLILECKANIGAGADLTLELSKGVNRFQAVFAEGKVTLRRTGPGGDKFGTPSRPCKVTAGTDHTLRFANVDCRLWVWVDGKRVGFGADGDYQPATPQQEAEFEDANGSRGVQPEGYTHANDILAPASVGAKGKATVQNLKLHRDVYYTRRGSDHAKADLYYVQPGHYMCLGDNSAQSSDSRNWGTVPERLMLGKAVFVFWPAWPKNRVGFIK